MNYHDNWEAISHSQIKIAKKSLARFGGMANGTIPRDSDSPALAFGRLFHTVVLEPWVDIHVEDGPINPRTHKPYGTGTKAYCEWRESIDGPVASACDYAKAIRMREAVDANPLSFGLIRDEQYNRKIEHEIYWHDVIDRKAKIDAINLGQNAAIVVDLKSSEDPRPEPFAHSAGKYGYHTQAAANIDAVKAETGLADVTFQIVAVAKDIPHDVYVHEFSDEAIEAGRRSNAYWLEKIKDCRESGVWMSDAQRCVNELVIPGYFLGL